MIYIVKYTIERHLICRFIAYSHKLKPICVLLSLRGTVLKTQEKPVRMNDTTNTLKDDKVTALTDA